MKIFSEKTRKFYPTVEECEAAEVEFDEKQARIAAEKAEKAAQRKERAKEVEEAYKAAEEARKHFVELRNKFIDDYGAFHMTVSNRETPSLFEDLFRTFF